MKINRGMISLAWAASIPVAWFIVALLLDQGPLQQQRSTSLTRYGALLGSDFVLSESWRLIASQWLHVNFKHMIFNALIIASAGFALERWMRGTTVLMLGTAGGAVAQWTTVRLHPAEYISGASQAYLVLCGMLLAIAFESKGRHLFSIAVSVVGISVAITLDIVISDHHAIKAGHLTGLVFGLTVGALLVVADRRRRGPEIR